MRDIIITKDCVIANMKRVLELLQDENLELRPNWYGDRTLAELKVKMREIRRDTVEIEKFMK